MSIGVDLCRAAELRDIILFYDHLYSELHVDIDDKRNSIPENHHRPKDTDQAQKQMTASPTEKQADECPVAADSHSNKC